MKYNLQPGCAVTKREVDPWWKAEIAKPHFITRIRIYPRLGHKNTKDYTKVIVSVSMDGQSWALCMDLGDQLSKATGWVVATCPEGTVGSFVKITLHNNDAELTVCEVEGWGYPE